MHQTPHRVADAVRCFVLLLRVVCHLRTIPKPWKVRKKIGDLLCLVVVSFGTICLSLSLLCIHSSSWYRLIVEGVSRPKLSDLSDTRVVNIRDKIVGLHVLAQGNMRIWLFLAVTWLALREFSKGEALVELAFVGDSLESGTHFSTWSSLLYRIVTCFGSSLAS